MSLKRKNDNQEEREFIDYPFLPELHSRDDQIQLSDLPEIPGDQSFYLEWQSGYDNPLSELRIILPCREYFTTATSEVRTMLFDRVIWRKKRTYEAIHAYLRDVPVLIEKYGDRLKDIKIVGNVWFFGDTSFQGSIQQKYDQFRKEQHFDKNFDTRFLVGDEDRNKKRKIDQNVDLDSNIDLSSDSSSDSSPDSSSDSSSEIIINRLILEKCTLSCQNKELKRQNEELERRNKELEESNENTCLHLVIENQFLKQEKEDLRRQIEELKGGN